MLTSVMLSELTAELTKQRNETMSFEKVEAFCFDCMHADYSCEMEAKRAAWRHCVTRPSARRRHAPLSESHTCNTANPRV